MAKVGIIRISDTNPQLARNLLDELQIWLQTSGWQDVVSVYVSDTTDDSFVDLIPGKYQSNGPRRIWLRQGARLRDFEKSLARWLWEVESGN